MTNASNEPLDVGDDEAINDDSAEADEIRSSASTGTAGDAVRDNQGDDDQDAEPSGNAPPGEAPNDPSGS